MARKPTRVIVQRALKYATSKDIEMPEDVYTNERVRVKFMEIMHKSTYFKSAYAILIQKMVDQQIIVPVNVRQPTLIEKIKTALGMHTRLEFAKHALAFYSSHYGRIFILLDNMEKHSFSPNEIAKVILHELQHMIANKFPQQFFTYHSKLFGEFYSYFFNHILSVDEKYYSKPATVGPAIKFAIDEIEAPGRITMGLLTKFRGLIVKSFNIDKMSDDEYRKLNNSVEALQEVMVNVVTGRYYGNVRSGQGNDRIVCFRLRDAYIHVKIDPNNSFIGQEVVYPSELICIQSESSPSSSHFQLIAKLIN